MHPLAPARAQPGGFIPGEPGSGLGHRLTANHPEQGLRGIFPRCLPRPSRTIHMRRRWHRRAWICCGRWSRVRSADDGRRGGGAVRRRVRGGQPGPGQLPQRVPAAGAGHPRGDGRAGDPQAADQVVLPVVPGRPPTGRAPRTATRCSGWSHLSHGSWTRMPRWPRPGTGWSSPSPGRLAAPGH